MKSSKIFLILLALAGTGCMQNSRCGKVSMRGQVFSLLEGDFDSPTPESTERREQKEQRDMKYMAETIVRRTPIGQGITEIKYGDGRIFHLRIADSTT